MGNSGFKFSEDALRKLEEEAIRKLQPQVDAKAQEIVRGIRDEMQGQPSEQVYTELVAQLEASGFKPNEQNIRVIAEEIEAGTLEG